MLLPLFALAFLMSCTSGNTPVAEECTPNSEFGEASDTVVLATSMGDITVELYGASAPKTVDNFVELASTGYYNGLNFHRVIPSFMIQGGDPNGDGTGGESVYGGPFEDEINAESYCLHTITVRDLQPDAALPDELKDKSIAELYTEQGYNYNSSLNSLPLDRGVLAMANRGANTNGSQFFIIQKEGGTPWLEGKHTAFGRVVEGMDIVDAIAAVKTGENNVPVEAVTYDIEIVD